MAVEVVDHAEALLGGDRAVHAEVAHASIRDVALDDVQHLLCLGEQQRLVAPRPPLLQYLQPGTLTPAASAPPTRDARPSAGREGPR